MPISRFHHLPWSCALQTKNGPVELVEKLFHGRALWLPPCLWCIEAHKENPEVHGGLTVAALSPLINALKRMHAFSMISFVY